ncbi:isocitrate lyase/phosphoenolpyruvate mutase family protein [Micromonospora sp. C28SCA-DRY-2]|uniref:isocitrate lyase/phosphoenolpyruvate mutase family protein n=1 Tax=Micromonospora sp. C28SCA-DRY-2 TaxID=3059522 RepID=UPI002676575A|nr:isocitrate lyase/phosphoenolpyruvate mutase family protein [Micromonospora sp. C28SCA-DRY-2]MDO3704060.1 isocitrate lyase/phosphoenolpyruvate mutase family protein [Micromonospora sp. C28SCA-DRY-2]
MSAESLRRALTARTGIPVRAVGAVNALAATAAAGAGFDALWVSSLEVSAAAGLADANVLGVRDLCDVVLAVGRTAHLPVVVDVDNAGGFAESARRCAFDLARAGAAALCLEDSAYPKCNSFSTHRAQGLADVGVVADQLREMRRASDELVLIARTEALIAGAPFSHALERATYYAVHGADAVLIHSRDASGHEALRTAREWNSPVPLVTVPTAFAHLGWQELGLAGFAMCIYANQLSRAALAGMRAAAAELAGTGSPGTVPLATVGELLAIGDPYARV